MSQHRPFTGVGYVPDFFNAQRARRCCAKRLDRFEQLPLRVREIITACANKHTVLIADIMAGARHRQAVLCRDEVHYKLHTQMKPRATVDQIAEWLGRDPAGLMYSIGRHAVRGRQRRKTA